MVQEVAYLAVDILQSSKAFVDPPVMVSTDWIDMDGKLTVRLEHVKHHATSSSISIVADRSEAADGIQLEDLKRMRVTRD